MIKPTLRNAAANSENRRRIAHVLSASTCWLPRSARCRDALSSEKVLRGASGSGWERPGSVAVKAQRPGKRRFHAPARPRRRHCGASATGRCAIPIRPHCDVTTRRGCGAAIPRGGRGWCDYYDFVREEFCALDAAATVLRGDVVGDPPHESLWQRLFIEFAKRVAELAKDVRQQLRTRTGPGVGVREGPLRRYRRARGDKARGQPRAQRGVLIHLTGRSS